jgi:two-component system, NarL family, sensor kinase
VTTPVDRTAGVSGVPLAPAPRRAEDDWVLLADPEAPVRTERARSVRRVVAPIAVAAVVVAVLVGIAGSLVSKRVAEEQAVHDVAQLTDVLAANVVQPALTDPMTSDPALTRRVLDPIVGRLDNASLVRIKLWTPTGTVLYSDDAQLIGRRFALEPEAREALSSPRTEADVSDLQRPENRFERDEGKLLEVYRPVWTPAGEPLLFETYFRYDLVSQRSHQLWRGFGGVMLSSLAALVLLLLPLAASLSVRARRARAQREQLMRRALAASEDERGRIAATLHDGVVQDLAAASFTAAAQRESAAAAGDHERAAGLDTIAATVRDSIAGLRSLLVDIYPPSLHTSGLAAALRDLGRSSAAGAAIVTLDVDVDAADQLPVPVQEAAFRVAQEALRNAARHAEAHSVTVRLHALGAAWVRLEIADDGAGFDAQSMAAQAAPGHFGLQLMTDAARRCGARLTIATAPGSGTRVRLEVPR